MSDDDDEDEETLQLKLQEIQAKLKLKKLQNARAKDSSTSSQIDNGDFASSSTSNKRGLLGSPSTSNLRSGRQQDIIQVPVSPVRKVQANVDPLSPSRVRLGIDKGLTAKDISLKRAPSHKRLNGSPLAKRTGDFLSKASDPISNQSDAARPSSFSERMSNLRNEELVRKERQSKIQKLRSNAFGIGQAEIDTYKTTAIDIPDEPIHAVAFSREDILSRSNSQSTSKLPGSRTTPNMNGTSSSNADIRGHSLATGHGSSKEMDAKDTESEPSSSFESYSSLHLSRRIIPHNVLARHVSGKATFSIKDLLREVKSPDYSLPDVEQDIVVFGILAKKSEPRSHKPASNKKEESEERGKYMIMTLVDLDFEVDLFLFDSGFERFWKLTEGTVVAILNPNVMPPPKGKLDTGRFSLVINSDEDTILEIGRARDLGFCQSIKKDGQLCGSWVNKKRTQFCEFHSNEAVAKQRSSRIEMNTSSFGPRERGRGRGGRGGFFGHSGNGKDLDTERYDGKSKNYDWESRSQFFATRSMSASDLIDGKDKDFANKRERTEFLKRSMEAKEKERMMMKKLGEIGHAAGREYMQFSGSKSAKESATTDTTTTTSHNDQQAANMKENNIMELTRGDRVIHLSPVKRKRPESSDAGSSVVRSSATTAYGWGSNLKTKLSNMKAGEKFLRKEDPPVRKKTRFITEKGIRVAGRESLGADLVEGQISFDDDDDDELVILR